MPRPVQKYKIKKAREEFWEKLPEEQKIVDNLSGFEALLLKASTTIEPHVKKIKRKRSKRDKSVQLGERLLPKKKRKD